MGSKVHRFLINKNTASPNDRFDKVLRLLRILRFTECAANHKFSLTVGRTVKPMNHRTYEPFISYDMQTK